MRGLAVIVTVIGACGGGQPALFPAGTPNDDGHGLLARASSRFMTAEATEDDLFAASGPRAGDTDDGDASYGGAGYGGATYASYVVPTWPSASGRASPKYNQVPGLSGAIDGVITWRGAPPPRLITTCGFVEGLEVRDDRAVADVLVYIERVQVGRTLPNDGRSVSIGGTLVKRGCALAPIVQIVTPLPAAVAIHGDNRTTRLRVTQGSSPPRHLEIAEGGRAAVPILDGITRIDAEDGSFASAWVVALDTPYYAITDDRGRFRIDELAAGTYKVTIWQPPVATIAAGKLRYAAPVVVHRTVRVDTARAARLDVALGR